MINETYPRLFLSILFGFGSGVQMWVVTCIFPCIHKVQVHSSCGGAGRGQSLEP